MSTVDSNAIILWRHWHTSCAKVKSSSAKRGKKRIRPASPKKRSKLWPRQHASSCSQCYQCHAPPFAETILYTVIFFSTPIFASSPAPLHPMHATYVRDEMENYRLTQFYQSQWQADNKMKTEHFAHLPYGVLGAWWMRVRWGCDNLHTLWSEWHAKWFTNFQRQ